ncbi:DUF1648 domain-containing protein [Roseivirga echinicomitans]
MNENGRPRIKLRLSVLDKVMEVLGWLLLIGIWVLTLDSYPNLPDTIPIHFNAAGKPDGFGSKWNILTLPVIASVLFIGMSILNKYPHVFNYPESITEEYALKSYTMATRLIRVLKLVLVIIFGMIVYSTLQNINGKADGLGPWFMPLTLGMIFIPIVYYLIKAMRKETTKNASF